MKLLYKLGIGLTCLIPALKCISSIASGTHNAEDYPICKTCGAKMTDFDGVAWYTCPKCGNSVRIIDGITTWENEIFKEGKKDYKSDFELADYCRGGDLTED